jgi:hypothetical protein
MELYTSDMDLATFTPSVEKSKAERPKRGLKRKMIRAKIMNENFDTSSLFDTSKELLHVRYS